MWQNHITYCWQTVSEQNSHRPVTSLLSRLLSYKTACTLLHSAPDSDLTCAPEQHNDKHRCNIQLGATHTHTHPFNSPLSRTTRVSRYQRGKTQSGFYQSRSGSGISWAICKSAPRSRQTTMPASHHSVFYRPDALPVAQPTASKH